MRYFEDQYPVGPPNAYKNVEPFIAAQIEEAEREASEDCPFCENEFERGFRAAQKKAAEIAAVANSHIADRIRKMGIEE